MLPPGLATQKFAIIAAFFVHQSLYIFLLNFSITFFLYNIVLELYIILLWTVCFTDWSYNSFVMKKYIEKKKKYRYVPNPLPFLVPKKEED